MTRPAASTDPASTPLPLAIPVRLQRRPGWTAPLDHDGRRPVYIARPTRWANTHQHNPRLAAEQALAAYTSDLHAGRLQVSVADIRRELAGRDLS